MRAAISPCPPAPLLLAAFAMMATLAAPAPAEPGARVVRRAWIERRGDLFAIHLRLSGRPRWTLNRDANRLLIELADTRPGWPSDQFLHTALGDLGSVRVLGEGESVRIELEAAAGCDYAVGRRHYELIVAMAPRGSGPRMAQFFINDFSSRVRRVRRSAPAVAPHPSIVRAERDQAQPHPIPEDAVAREEGPAIVVVDPGHGGHDPGTRSADGVLEKDLALQIALRLSQALAKRGVKPVMTRRSDIYLSLAQRTAIANNTGADLFVSVHLNWSPNPGTEGIEVYYLNNTTDRATIRLARMENAAPGGRAPLNPDLNYILSDLQQQYKATQSALLAQGMEEQTVNALQGGFGDIRGLGARRGPFYVLVGPRIPAVLVECGFLSNSAEARRLSSPAYQQQLADALADSVVHYLNQDVSAGAL